MRNETWIEVTRSWIDAAIVRRSGIVRCHRFWRAEDASGDEALADEVREALGALGPRPGRVHVLWSAPGAAVDLCPIPIPGAQGLRAVALSHAAAAGLVPGVDPVAVAPISSRSHQPAADAPLPLAIAVGIAADQWRIISRAIESAGGTLASVHASQAAALHATVIDALAATTTPLAVSVTVEEDGSAIAIRVDGQIALARTVDLGAAALRRSYDHALRDAGRADVDPHARSIVEMADEMLHACGVPEPDAPLPNNVSADLVFQMMRPALQRLVFEVKQTIRFTASDASVPTEQTGPQAVLRIVHTTVPHLSALLAHECAATDESPPHATDAGVGDGIRRALAHDAPPLPLHLPTNAASQRTTRTRIALASGCAVALALGATDAWSAGSRASDLERTAIEMEQALDGETPTDEAVLRHAGAVSDSSALITRELGPVAPWAGGIAAVAREFGDTVRILRVSGDRTQAGSILRLEAEIAAPSAAEARTALGLAVGRLRACPLVHAVDIPSIDQESRTETVVLGFVVEVSLKEAAATWVAEVSL